MPSIVSRPSGFPSKRVPQRSILGSLFFSLYINDLPNGLLSNPKLFASDTSIFSVLKDHLNTSNKLNEDLSKISQSAYHSKISFNHDISKQAQKVIFSCKTENLLKYTLVYWWMENYIFRTSMKNFAIYLRSYHQSGLPISMICYLHCKDLTAIKVSFSHCCVERKSSKTLFYHIR